MSMYFVGIDISKYKHDCCIISAADQQIVSKFTVKNDKDGFEHLLTTLNSLSNPEDIKIGFESTAHYALNLELFLENAHHSFMEVNPHYMSIPGIGPISAAVIYAEYGDISNFSNPGQMLAFAGIEPGINDSGTESHGGRMVKHGSSQLRYVLLNACLPLIRFDITFATYYAKKRAEGKKHRVAITHVAKKLIRVIYALERQDVDFNVQKLR